VSLKYLSAFPEGYTPTPAQTALLSKIENAYKCGKKFVICCAPTGSGKSMIAKTFDKLSKPASSKYNDLITSHDAFRQNYLGEFIHEDDCTSEGPANAFVLTITKSLQDQYQSIFKDVAVIKGKSNYMCNINRNVDVEGGPCVLSKKLKETCWRENACSYYTARKEGLVNRFSALNYKMFLSLPGHVKHRSFLVCDEASELEEELVKRFSAEISILKLNRNDVVCDLPADILPESVRPWISNLILEMSQVIEGLKARLSKKKNDPTVTEIARLKYLTATHNSLILVDTHWDHAEYIIEKVGDDFIKLTPLRVDKLASSIFDYGDRVLLLSATIIDHKNFAKTLGIADYEYIEADSLFDPNKSPILISTKHKLNYSLLKTNLPKVIDMVAGIIDQHSNVKGIIHTHTQSICDELQYRLGDNKRFLFRTERQTNEDILRDHFTSSEPTVLVSPSLAYGIDLKDELARFQIVIKLPFLPLSDKRIKKLFDLDKDWYENRMLNTMVQACGRATRSADDHSVTYILDGCIKDVILRAKHKLPKHFINRIQ